MSTSSINRKKPLKVGITGGIGSGKSFVCNLFKTLGVPVYHADDRAKWLMVENDCLRAKLSDLFGLETYLENGQLNREHIASIVFSDKQMLQRLNELVHPAVAIDFESWVKEQPNVKYVLKEAALIFETGGEKHLDKTIVVQAPEELRIQRVMERDAISRSKVLERIANQWPAEKKAEMADYLIDNGGTELLITQVQRLHKLLSQ